MSYPVFEGDGTALANKFYDRLARCAEEYFIPLTAERHICKASFSVEDSADFFTVDYTITLRKCGKRCGEKHFAHRWKRYPGRDAVIDG